jgi:hypothetical protein
VKNKLTVSIITIQTVLLAGLIVYLLIPKSGLSLERGQSGASGTDYWVMSNGSKTPLGYFSLDEKGQVWLVSFDTKQGRSFFSALDENGANLEVRDKELNFATSLSFSPSLDGKILFHKDSLDGKTLPLFISFKDRPKVLSPEEVKGALGDLKPEGPAE